jgi:hypothetical protein
MRLNIDSWVSIDRINEYDFSDAVSFVIQITLSISHSIPELPSNQIYFQLIQFQYVMFRVRMTAFRRTRLEQPSANH